MISIVFTRCNKRWEINGNVSLINLIDIQLARIAVDLTNLRTPTGFKNFPAKVIFWRA